MSDAFPMICENCLPQDKFLKMSRERNGAACKLCDRPFDVYKWRVDDSNRSKKTEICLDCAKVKNICQCCMLDLDYDIPYYVRDAALAQINGTIEQQTTNDPSSTWLLDVSKSKYELTGKNDYENLDVDKTLKKLMKRHNYDSNVPGAPKKENSLFKRTNEQNSKKQSKVTSVYVEKKPKKSKSFLK
ncbi:Pre-mRNA-splicing factor SLT11 [Entamoeba marina]